MYSFYATGSATIVGNAYDDNGQTIATFVTNGNISSAYVFGFTSILNGTDATVRWATLPDGTVYTFANAFGRVRGMSWYMATSVQINYTTGAKVGLPATVNSPAIGLDVAFARVTAGG